MPVLDFHLFVAHPCSAVLGALKSYDPEKIDAGKALYATGSDVMGPMGYELTPLASRADALDFLKGHKGKRILSYGEVTPEIVARVGTGRF